MHNTIFVQHEETMLWMISFLDPFQTNRNIPARSVKSALAVKSYMGDAFVGMVFKEGRKATLFISSSTMNMGRAMMATCSHQKS